MTEERAYPTFSSDDPEAPRWMWHPRVHQRFDESCFYFLCRAHRPDFETIDVKMGKLLDESGIRSVSVYPLLGPFDCLIRAWASEERRRQFLVEARRAGSIVQALHEFRTDHDALRYIWWTGPWEVTPEAIADNLDPIERIAGADLSGQLASDSGLQQELERLAKLGIVDLIDPLPHGQTSIKFYVVLDGTLDPRERQRLSASLLEQFPAEREGIDNVSIYEGSGFGRVLLKAVAKDFAMLVAVAEQVSEIAQEHALRPMTLVLVNKRAAESDAIENLTQNLTPAVLNLARLISERLQLDPQQQSDVRERLSVLRPLDRDAYVELVSDYEDVFGDGDDARQFFALLSALIMDDVEAFGDALRFLLKTEGLLRQYLRRLWVDLYGDGWLERVRDAARTDPDLLIPKDVKEWTLQVLLRLAKQSAEVDPDCANLIDAGDLGPTWRTVLESVVQLRNEVAHSHVYEYNSLARFFPAVDGKEQSAAISAVLDAARVYIGLQSLRDA